MNNNKTKPNIVFIFSDQQRPDTIGCYGQKLPVTPNLDELARQGVVFNNAFSVQPLCGPARSCLQTGKYATQNGCYINGIALLDNKNNLGNLMSDNGYKTGYIGKWHLASIPENNEHFINSPVPENMRGGYIDKWVVSNLPELTSNSYSGYLFDDNKKIEFNKYRVDAFTDYAIEFIDSYKDEPFFLTVSYLEPHQQNNTDSHECPLGTENDFLDFDTPVGLLPGEGNWEKEYAKYLSTCHRIDQNIKRLTDKLKEYDIFDNTLIIYTSDHGSHFKTRPGTYKRSCHEGSIRVPMIFSGLNYSLGKAVNGLVSLLDVPVSIMKAAGITPPSDVCGLDLSEFINDENAIIHDDIFIQVSESELGRCIRTNRYKLHITSISKDDKFKKSGSDFKCAYLYDLENDPGEHINLINETLYSEVKLDLTRILKNKIKEIEKIEITILDSHSI